MNKRLLKFVALFEVATDPNACPAANITDFRRSSEIMSLFILEDERAVMVAVVNSAGCSPYIVLLI